MNLDVYKVVTKNITMEDLNMEETTLVLTQREAEFIRNLMMFADLSAKCNNYRDIIRNVSKQLPELTVIECLTNIQPMKVNIAKKFRKRWKWNFFRR